MNSDYNDIEKNSVLIIQNDLDRLKKLGGFLSENNFDILIATNSDQAQKIVLHKLPDVILFDGIDSNENQFDLIRSITKNKAASFNPIIFTIDADSQNDIEYINSMFDAGCTDFILTPIIGIDLIQHIRTQLKLSELNLNNFDIRYKEFKPHNRFETETTNKVDKNILLIEDNDLNITFIKSTLEEEGYHVIIADTGKNAIEEYTRQKPDLILLDMTLPDMNGNEINIELSALGNDAPVIVLSGFSKDDLLNKYPSLGLTEFMLKPINPETLIKNIKRLIDSDVKQIVDEDDIEVKYNYSLATEISKNSDELFNRFLHDFLLLTHDLIHEVDSIKKKEITELGDKMKHRVANYANYFGAETLLRLMKDFTYSMTRKNNISESNKLLEKIEFEVEALHKFYSNLRTIKNLPSL